MGSRGPTWPGEFGLGGGWCCLFLSQLSCFDGGGRNDWSCCFLEEVFAECSERTAFLASGTQSGHPCNWRTFGDFCIGLPHGQIPNSAHTKQCSCKFSSPHCYFAARFRPIATSKDKETLITSLFLGSLPQRIIYPFHREGFQGRIQEFAKGGRSLPFPFSPLLFSLSHLPPSPYK